MSTESQRFRDRAKDCRALAKSARDQIDAAMLEEIASDLDDEAQKMEDEEGVGDEPATPS